MLKELAGKQVRRAESPIRSPSTFGDTVNSLTDKESTVTAGCQPFVIRVDNTNPKLLSAHTGTLLATRIAIDGDKTSPEGGAVKNTSILLVFDEDLDGVTRGSRRLRGGRQHAARRQPLLRREEARLPRRSGPGSRTTGPMSSWLARYPTWPATPPRWRAHRGQQPGPRQDQPDSGGDPHRRH